MSNVITCPQGFVPRPHQLPFLQAMDGEEGKPETKIRRAVLVWHRRSGKDVACWCYMVKEAVQVPGIYYYFFPSYAQGMKAIWEGVDEKTGVKYLDYIPKAYVKNVLQQGMKITLQTTNGMESIIRIVGTDDFDSIRGTAPKGCVFSEQAYQDPRAWNEYARPALRASKNAWAVFNSTPQGANHFKDLYDMAVGNDKWFTSIETVLTTRDHEGNPLVSEADIEEERQSGADEDSIQQEFYCSFLTGARGAYYAPQIQEARDTGRIGNYDYSPNKYVNTYWDLGRSDSTAIWFGYPDGNRMVFIDYYEGHNYYISHYVDMMSEKGYKYGTHYLPHDAHNKVVNAQMSCKELLEGHLREAKMSTDIVVIPKPDNKNAVIQTVRALLPYCRFDQGRCRDGIKKLELYHKRWDPKRKVFLLEPIHDNSSHCADAFSIIPAAMERDSEVYDAPVTVINDYNPLDYAVNVIPNRRDWNYF